MMSIRYLPIFLSAAAAQSTFVALGNYMIQDHNTVTLKESSPTATTYAHNCPAIPSACQDALMDASSDSQYSSILSSIHAAAPTDNPCAGVPDSVIEKPDWIQCHDYTLVDGPQTYAFHMEQDGYTVDMDCKWKGEITSADVTCTMAQDGASNSNFEPSTMTETIPHSEITSDVMFETYTVVSATGGSAKETGGSAKESGTGAAAAKTTAAPTGTGEKAGAPTGDAQTGDAQNTDDSPGFAPAGPLSKGFVAVVGGAAALLAAAIAL
jgi:hypothetical protein